MLDYESLSNYLGNTVTVVSSVIVYLRENQDELNKTDYERKLFNFRIVFYENINKLAISFLKLLKIEDDSFSILALGSLTRSVFEAYRPFYYLTIDNVDEDYRDFRMLIFQVYCYIETANLIEALGDDINKTEIISNLINLKKRIRENDCFKKLTHESDIPEKIVFISFTGAENEDFGRDLKRKIVNNNGCFKSLKEIISERVKKLDTKITNNVQLEDIKNRFDNFFYKFFSNFVHSSAFSIALIPPNDPELFKPDLNIMISSVIFCLCLATEDVYELYPSIKEIIEYSKYKESLEGMSFFTGLLLGRHNQ